MSLVLAAALVPKELQRHERGKGLLSLRAGHPYRSFKMVVFEGGSSFSPPIRVRIPVSDLP